MQSPGPLGVILLVDDDVNITGLLKYNLGSEGFSLVTVPQAIDVDFNALSDVRLVIADAMNQTYTGMDLTREIKSNPATAHIPVILYSERDSESQVIAAFDAGAEDYILKPFSLRELVARIKAILRRHPRRFAPVEETKPAKPSEIVFSKINLRIDVENQRVISENTTVPLTKTEYAILLFLIKNYNNFYSRSEICSEVWKDDACANARIVDTNISRLRKKLGDVGRHIINRYGMGYAFVEEVI